MYTWNDFLNSIPTSGMLDYDGTLQEYLIALWQIIEKSHGELVSLELIYKALDDATKLEPMEFKDEWLNYDKLPDDYEPTKKDNGYEYLKRTILFQIADLQRMKKAGTLDLDPEALYFGVRSPTGHSWYNFHVRNFFSCAIAGFRSYGSQIGMPLNSTECSWQNLAVILHLGQIYE